MAKKTRKQYGSRPSGSFTRHAGKPSWVLESSRTPGGGFCETSLKSIKRRPMTQNQPETFQLSKSERIFGYVLITAITIELALRLL